MTLSDLTNALGDLAVKCGLVNYFAYGSSLQELNPEEVKEYPLVFIAPTGTHVFKKNVTRFGLSIFYIDRLWDANSNETDIYSVAVENLKNIINQSKYIWFVEAVEEEPRIRLFLEPEKLNDRCCGGYAEVWFEVLNDTECPTYFQKDWTPIGTGIPETGTP